MPIEHYLGGGVPGVDVRTPAELMEALDLLHTQVIDNLPEDGSAPYLRVLEEAMDRLGELGVRRP